MSDRCASLRLALSGAQRSRRASLLPLLSLLLTACLAFTPTPTTHDITLGDLDSDGDLDAFYANGESDGRQPNTVWLNQGGGHFTDSGQSIGLSDSFQIALADLDSDRDLDALEGGWGSIYLNDGGGFFTREGQPIPWVEGSFNRYADLGDLDADGDLDALLAGCCGAFNGDANDPWAIPPTSAVYFNDGAGRFTQSQALTEQGCPAAALGDLDSDGDLDAFLACQMLIIPASDPPQRTDVFGEGALAYLGAYTEQNHAPNRVYFNDGTGALTDSGQSLGDSASHALALGDLDSDGDLDALLGNLQGAEVWLNLGGAQAGAPGYFAPSPAPLGDLYTPKVMLGDLDADHDLDAVLLTYTRRGFGIQLWLNDGAARFTHSDQGFRLRKMTAVALGDLDNDGDLDLYAGSFQDGYLVWLNDGEGNYAKPR